MALAADLRAQAARIREFARSIVDARAQAEIEKMAAELEVRAKQLDNGEGGTSGT
jgi:hypothetical protein